MSVPAVMFRSEVFDPLGADCAAYLASSLRGRGAQIDDPPVSTRRGFRFKAALDGAQFVVVVRNASLRNTKEEWLVRVQRHYGFLQTLLGRGRTLEEAYPLCRELGAILRDGDVFLDVEWLS